MMAKRPADPMAVNSHGKRPRMSLSDAGSETSTGPAAEVAGDFRDSLADLVLNDRYAISTLTIIAKENTEHAQSISDVLLSHIRTVPPQRKLPALFVLDSIVKNVGTPYTIFLSRNLYKTFMEAYTLVDSSTRKQMESMLKTWKDPIPGSMDQKPVFPLDTTRNIESALIRARTVFEQQKHQSFPGLQRHPSHALPSRPPVSAEQQWRNSPAPPPSQFHPHAYAPMPHQQPYPQQQYGPPSADFSYGLPQSHHQRSQSMAPPSQQHQYPQQTRSPVPPPGYHSQYAPPPPPQFQQHYPPPQIRSPQPGYPSQYPPPPPQFQYPQSQPSYQPPPSVAPLPPPQPPPQHQWSMTALLQASGTHHTAAPPPPPPPQYQQPQSQPNGATFPGLNGLYQPQNKTATPVQQHPTPYAPPPQPDQSFATPPINTAALAGHKSIQGAQISDVKLTVASLKISRPGLLSTLFPSLPNSQCNTCGRRFPVDTPPGKQRKTRHLDAHFRTNMRMTAALETRGTGASRSWYIDEKEWIAYREHDDADAVIETPPETNGASGTDAERREGAGSTATGGGRVGGKAKALEKFIAAPSDAALRKQVCPICQEEFKAEYHEGEQEWVFMDAVKVPAVGEGAKVYHASCLEEMAKDRGH